MFKNIIFFRYRLLSEKLKNDEVDESVAVKYLIFSSILAGGVISVPVEITPSFFKYAKLDFILSVFDFIIAAIINVIGIWYLYHANCQGDGKDFFKRTICLAFPVSIFILIVYGIPSYFLLALLMNSFPVLDRISVIMLMIVFGIVYYRTNYYCLVFISGSQAIDQGD